VSAALAAIEGGADTPDVREARQLLNSLPTDALGAKEVQ
jgi:hypothetical protein